VTHVEDFAMPKVLIPKPLDKRSRVDRLLDRIKNNRVAAVIVVACIGVGALASLTDSVRKLGAALPSSSNKSTAGEWKSDAAVFRPDIGPEFVRLYLTEPTSDRVVGSIQFSGNRDVAPIAFPLVEGKRSGKSITLTLADGQTSPPTFAGELVGSELHVVYQHPQRGAVAATFHRIDQAAQLVDGHFAIVYQHREFPDHRSACTQLLSDLHPPQDYANSEPPDDDGNVHCAGRRIDGRWNFDQFQNDVQRQLVCPAHAQVTLIGGQALAKSTRGCECEGTLAATAGRCATHS
jgi:hypothetical protein